MTVEYSQNKDQKTLRLFFIRHGQTDHNVKKILQGHIDVDINAKGLSQAQQLAAHLRDIQFDKVVSSDLVRCVNTSKEIVAQQSKPVTIATTTNLREREMGVAQGLYMKDALAKYGEEFRNMGEKLSDLIKRVEEEFNAIIKDGVAEDYTNVGVCTHGGVLINFFNYLYDEKKFVLAPGLTKADMKVPFNTSVSIIDIDKESGRGTIQLFGNSMHLGGQYTVKDQWLR